MEEGCGGSWRGGAAGRAQDLWLNDNQLGSQQALLDRLAEVAGTLTTLYVANNPASAGQFALRVPPQPPSILDDCVFVEA